MKSSTPRAYRFRLDLEVVDLEDRWGGDVDAAFVEACRRLVKTPTSVLGGDIEYQVMDKMEDVVALVAMRQAMGAAEQGES